MALLWARGVDSNLVIVGSKGWMTDDLEDQIQKHQEYGRRLFWLQGISDEMLEQVYHSVSALLAASQGEGFGLPLVEAAQHGLPIIARDIPVFREVAGEHAYYFRGTGAPALADALSAWLSLGDAPPFSTGIPVLTWQESSRQLLDVVLGRRWYRLWPDTATISKSAGANASDSETIMTGSAELAGPCASETRPYLDSR
jgi:glycosyltransferase involved in cell wall biosynthesis